MNKALSMGIGDRIIDSIRDGLSCRGAARHFRVGVSSVIRLKHGYQRTGRVPVAKVRARRSSKLDDFRSYLIDLVQEQGDLTLSELSDKLFKDKGVRVCVATMHRFYARENITYKKD